MAYHPKERFPSKINGSRPTGCMAASDNRSPAITSDDERHNSYDSDFMNKMSHDFYTPLNIIIGFAELMLEEIPGEINEQQRSSLTDILNSGNRLLTLVDELMAKYKSESGKMA
jgi:signal transduction histidine kinase